MVRDTPARESEIERLLGPSRWIDLRGSGTSKWCPEEGRVVLEMLKQLAESELESPDIFVISPFRVVRTEMRDLVRRNQSAFSRWSENMRSWTNDRIGTIHTFQGREAEAVILLLGAPNAEQIGARNWAGGRPNLLNVAATRAKSAFYVVGSRQLWKQSGCFGRLDYLLT